MATYYKIKIILKIKSLFWNTIHNLIGIYYLEKQLFLWFLNAVDLLKFFYFNLRL